MLQDPMFVQKIYDHTLTGSPLDCHKFIKVYPMPRRMLKTKLHSLASATRKKVVIMPKA